MKLLIRSCKIADTLKNYQGLQDIYIEDGIIRKISPHTEEKAEAGYDAVINAQGLTVMPGFIDMHAHLREPGFEKKETVKTGTMAAAKGGYTTICCMPNTKPVIDDEESLQRLLEAIQKDAAIHVLPIAAITKGQRSEALTDMKALKEKGAAAFSDDGLPVADTVLLREALRQAKAMDLLLIEHCEEMSLAKGGAVHEGEASERLGLRGIPALSEELPVMRDVMLSEETGAHIHIAHISTRKSAEIIRNAKEKGIRVTCEVTPHHIGLCDTIITEGFTDCKVNPPLRSREDMEAVKKALAEGVIDVIATDHAPHHAEDKGTDFYTAANGISGIETAFPVCYTELVLSGVLTLRELMQKMSLNAAKLLKLDKGLICEGAAADIAIADLEKEITIDKNNFLSKGKNTPFHGRSYKGDIRYTIVSGQIVYAKEEE